MGKYDKWLIGGGLLVGLAGLMWYADNLVKGASKSFAEGIKLPALPLSGGINVTMPSITLPNINLGGFNLSNLEKGVIDGLKTASPLPNSTDQQILDWINQVRPGWIFSKSADPGATPLPSDVRTSTLSGWFQGIQDTFSAPIIPTKSTSEGGNGIRVENGDNDYYVPDNSLYGSSGMPKPATPAPVSSPIVPTINVDTAVEYSKHQAAMQNGPTTPIPHAPELQVHQVTRTIFKENTDPTKGRVGIMLPVTETVTEYW